MGVPVSFLLAVVQETYRVVVDSALFLLVGFVLAGVLHELVDVARVAHALGARNLRSILVATLVGAPLPLCSCGVLPAAVALRRKGASREATVAFLISTPETGADSVLLTYGLFGPLLAVVRPLAAIVTSVVAGLLSLLSPPSPPDLPVLGDAPAGAGRGEGEGAGGGLRGRVERIGRYAFVTMMDELAFWLASAFLLTGILAALLPAGFFLRFLPSPIVGMVLMALIGIPTYVCASASTPLAAALVAKGLSPGAALVFMLTGPATNASTIAVVARLFGRRFLLVYLGAIFGVAIAAGLALDAVLGAGIVPRPAVASAEATGLFALVKLASAFVLLVALFLSLKRRGVREGIEELRGHGRALAELVASIPFGRVPRRALAWTAAAAAVLLAGWSSILVVRPGEAGVVRTFGRVTASRLPPGLHLVPPYPIGRAEVVAVDRVRAVSVGFRLRPDEAASKGAALASGTFVPGRSMRLAEEAQLVTGDENVIEVAGIVTYRVADPARFLFGVDRVEAALRDLARSFLVEEAGTMPIDAIYSAERGTAERAVLARLAACPSLPEMGVRVEDVRLLYVHAPDEVHTAFRDVASASEDGKTLRNKALVAAEGELGAARSDAARTVAEAESARMESVDTARGDAAAFVPLAREVRAAPAVSRFRLRVETLERSLAGVPKVIRPAGRKAGSLELWIVPPATGPGGAPAAGASAAGPGAPPLSGISGLSGLSRLLDPIPAPVEEPVPEPAPTPQEPNDR